MKILFTGGGTGGHTFPIIAVARELKKIDPSLDLYFIGPKKEVVPSDLEKEGIKVKKVLSGKIRRYKGFSSKISNFIDLFIKTPLGLIQSFFYIFFLSPDLVFSKGGYGAVPPTLAARILQVPIFLHESDIAPGVANQFLSRFALEVFTSFPKTEFFPPKKLILIGNPVRNELFLPLSKDEENCFDLKTEKPVLLILGGSQGSERINDLTLEILPGLLSNFEVIHQCGSLNYDNLLIESDFLIPEDLKDSYHLLPFLNEKELRCAYSISDIIVSRAGSGSIFEIAIAAKPSILIPLSESAQNHQSKNAHSYSDLGCALVIEEDNLTPHFFLQKVVALMKSPSARRNMINQASKFSKPRSAKIIAEYIVEFLR
ncbi:MAG: UDP-N-acetylglucosamine--N-acetylmuramyl-(pentapeptide) pyrophosphoryl-undecaprenol N-acetylglucosamine transferase [Minisyncoccales bacterium]|jgi:UDP-N-acetylglucosamine--N-acetylmuramyl-(pentapeptide) pyrophosphoryl-undecaprenol N-acetylglucosamine transferase